MFGGAKVTEPQWGGCYIHARFLADELGRFISPGSFAWRLRRAIAGELHYRLVDWPDEHEVEYSSIFPVEALYVWATTDGGLDPEWLSTEDGIYLDDDGEPIPKTLTPTYSAVEQLAVYGLWFLEEEMHSVGPLPEEGHNDHGFKRDEVIEHQASRLLFAYQALSYCNRITAGTTLTDDQSKQADKFNFSEMGKIGAQKRHAPMANLRDWALQRYKAGNHQWKSANEAAHALRDEVVAHGRTINAHLSEQNAQRTIAEWFRKSA